MKIGILAFISEESISPAEVARKCEALGFESLFLPEHAIIPVKHRVPYPAGDGTIPEPYAHFPDPFAMRTYYHGALEPGQLNTRADLQSTPHSRTSPRLRSFCPTGVDSERLAPSKRRSKSGLAVVPVLKSSKTVACELSPIRLPLGKFPRSAAVHSPGGLEG